MEPGDNEAIEEQILEAMKHTTVIGGFCSTCQTMLDNWPDLEIANRELYNTEAHLTERKDRSNPGTSLFSKDANLASRFWIGQHYHVLADLPCYEDVSRLLAGARHGCRFCGFILRRKKYGNRLEQFLKIHRGLQKLGKSSQIYMVVSSVTQNTTRFGPSAAHYTLLVSFPGRRLREVCPGLRNTFAYSFPVKSNSPCHFPLRNSKSPVTYMGLAKHWTQTCLESHKQCNLNRPLQYPTRLLSIAANSARVVSTMSWTEKPRYATPEPLLGKS
ncbi:hypothetical protein F5883DRAFT_547619 [Diaporthe sp. PMI_573]|nr:hypothetical protein F5883DRAFT_547619 [Diaporthaceae sp. PMI_573]